MDEKGQGALEYLLLIAGALLVAAVVIFLLSRIVGDTEGKVTDKLDTGLADITGETTPAPAP